TGAMTTGLRSISPGSRRSIAFAWASPECLCRGPRRSSRGRTTAMSHAEPASRTFRSRIQNRQHVLGTFVKLPTPQVVEIVGQVGFDFVIIDQEHSPLDRAAIDIACLAARASNIAAIVRVSEVANILSALDSGATGVMVPHCDSPERARQIAAA